MKTKTQTHTPGPWSLSVGRTINGSRAVMPSDDGSDKNGREIAVMRGVDGEANARLIAAAPDLLEAARTAASNIEEGYPQDASVILEELLSAIAKAEGR